MIKELKRFPNYYVTDDGKVFHNNHQLKPIKVRRGYLSVDIKGKRYMIHRLVAEEFIDNFSFDMQVHHKDNNVQNNQVDNLICLTQQEHMRLHRLKNPITKTCVYCGNSFTPNPTKRLVAKFCNRQCYIEWKRQEVRKLNNDSIAAQL